MSAALHELEDTLDDVRPQLGRDLGMELQELLDYVGRSEHVPLLFGAVPQDHAFSAVPKAGCEGG
jgi:hypothetical protein